MPEGDTVLRTARRLHAALAGAVLRRADLRWGDLDGTPLVGATTVDVVARGKHILQRIDTGHTLHSHLRMEGSWHITAATENARRRPGDVRAMLVTDAWKATGLRLGMLDLVPTSQEDRFVGHLGPDVLGEDWDEDEAVSRLAASPATIGAALLDQRNLAGVGTMYASESLFLERLNPWTPAAELDADVVRRLVRRAHRLLNANVAHAVQSTTGSRRNGENVYVHGRSGLPCRRCGTILRVAMIGPPTQERTMFSCTTCQPGARPTDDGRPQRPLGTSDRSPRNRRTYRG